MSSSLAKKISHSLSSYCLYLNGFPCRLQSLHHHPFRFASSVACAPCAYRAKPKPVAQSATKNHHKVSSHVSYTKKLAEKQKELTENKLQEKPTDQEDSDEEPEWFKKLEIRFEPEEKDIPEGEDWGENLPTEYRNGQVVFTVVDHIPGEDKITLVRECDDGARIKFVAKLNDDHRFMGMIVSIKKENKHERFSIYSKRGPVGVWMDCDCDTENLSEVEARKKLSRRGINQSLLQFVRRYLIIKFLKGYL